MDRVEVMKRHLRSALDAIEQAEHEAYWRGPKESQREHEAVAAYHAKRVVALAEEASDNG